MGFSSNILGSADPLVDENEFMFLNVMTFKLLFIFRISDKHLRPGSSVSIVTGYGMDGPGIESRWGRDFPQTGPGAHPASCTTGTGSFPDGRKRPGRDAEPSPPSSAEV
jgi:hypothetical protein